MQIIWKGNQHTNSDSRGDYIPFVIVNHISAGSMASMDAWFTSPNNQVSSAHFGISRAGTIHQYVEIERMAWTQGISNSQVQSSLAQVVKDMGVNPNYYSVSIEHEGMQGELTEKQFQASVWLHRYIQQTIYDKWKKFFPLDRYHVIGHYQVNPKQKGACPGRKFPWERLYSTLQEGADEMELYRTRIETLEKHVALLEEAIKKLEAKDSMDTIPLWAKDSVNKAVQSGLIDTPEGGSYDFYRVLTILKRKGII